MKTAARMEVLAAALLFSTAGAAIKAITLTSWQVACFRSGIAAVAVLALLPEARRRWPPGTLWASTAFAATLFLFVTATKMTTAANAIFLQSTGPLYLLFLSPWMLKEPARRRDILILSAMAVGLALFFLGDNAPQRTAPHPAAGNVLAAVAGLTWALTVIGLRRLARNGRGSVGVVAAGNLITCAACLGPALSVPVRATAADWVILGYLGVFQIGLAYYLLTRAVRSLPALETSMLVLLEPALNPVWAWLVHDERVAPASIAGGVCIVGSTVLLVLAGRREPDQAGSASRTRGRGVAEAKGFSDRVTKTPDSES